MFNWKVEEMVLMNQKDGFFIGNEKIYDCERELSREEKIEFIDKMQNGKLSYILNLIEKFEKEKSSLKVDSIGNIKTVSLKAWLKKNDTLSLVDNSYNYGKFYILGREGYIQYPDRENHYDTFSDIVDELFHRQILKCVQMERKYFLDNDEYTILKRHIKSQYDKYSVGFGAHLGFCSDGNIYVYEDNDNDEDDDTKYREITMEELKDLSDKYAQLDALVEKISLDTNIKY